MYARTRGPLEEWANVEIYPQDQCKRVPISEMKTPAHLLSYLDLPSGSYSLILYPALSQRRGEWPEIVEALRDHATHRLAIHTESNSVASFPPPLQHTDSRDIVREYRASIHASTVQASPTLRRSKAPIDGRLSSL